MCVVTVERELAATFRRIKPVLEFQAAVVGHPPSPDGWLACADLLADGGAELDRRLDGLAALYGSREVAASFLLIWYAGGVVVPAVAAYLGERRVPDVDVRRLHLKVRDPGWFDVTAFARPQVSVLPSDPLAAGLSGNANAGRDVEVVADLTALRARLAEGLVGHLEPVVAALRERVRLGPQALWGLVAAQAGTTFLRAADPVAGRDEAMAFFAAASPPMRALPTWREFTVSGRTHVAMRQGSCCLAFRLRMTFCAACPFTSDDERELRLRENLARRAATRA